MQNNGNQNNQQSSNSNNLQSSSVNQISSSNIGPRIMQNPSVSLIVDNGLTDEVGVAVVDPDISNQRTNQIAGATTQRAYLAPLLCTAITALGATTTALISTLISCEGVSNKSKFNCREYAAVASIGSGASILLIGSVLVLARHVIQSNFRVHPEPQTDLSPPDHAILLGVPQNIGGDHPSPRQVSSAQVAERNQNMASPQERA